MLLTSLGLRCIRAAPPPSQLTFIGNGRVGIQHLGEKLQKNVEQRKKFGAIQEDVGGFHPNGSFRALIDCPFDGLMRC